MKLKFKHCVREHTWFAWYPVWSVADGHIYWLEKVQCICDQYTHHSYAGIAKHMYRYWKDRRSALTVALDENSPTDSFVSSGTNITSSNNGQVIPGKSNSAVVWK